ncbi:FkbM family methyltransferase [Azospirillum sp. INR13]|nr:FkbM family methyltransferase [Azospirillum sp. INR13]
MRSAILQQPSALQAGQTGAGQKPASIPVLQGSLTEILGYLSKELPKFPRRVPGRLLADGVELRYVDLHSFYYQSLQILNHRLYEFETDEAAPLIIDCGAHIGLASLFFARRFPQATIHAFEADPAIAEVLAFNVASLKLTGVTPHAKAVWIDGGGITFERSSDDSGHVRSGGSGPDMVTVPSVRLRDLIAGRDVSLLKLDVEGAEFAILRDCDGALGGVRKILLEVHCFGQSDASLGRLLCLLEDNGFRYGLSDLHQATWMQGEKPPFRELQTGKYLISVFAWR